MPEKPRHSADADLLRDLECLLRQTQAHPGGPPQGNIETAAVKAQAVRMIMEAIRKLEHRKLDALRQGSGYICQNQQALNAMLKERQNISNCTKVWQDDARLDEYNPRVRAFYYTWEDGYGKPQQSNRTFSFEGFPDEASRSVIEYKGYIEKKIAELRGSLAEITEIDGQLATYRQMLSELTGIPQKSSAGSASLGAL